MKKIIWAIAGLLLFQSAQAITLEGYEFPEEIQASHNGPLMKLQGAAVREWYLVVKGYIGALYLENPGNSVDNILMDEGYKRMSFTVLFKKMSARRIASSFYEAIQINLTEEEQIELEPKLNQFMSMIDGTLKQGESGVFEYIPTVGAKVTIAGEEKGIIEGKKIFDAILKVWIGETPPNRSFKQGILGFNDV